MGVRRPPRVISAVSHLQGVSYPRITLHIDCLAQLVSQDTGIRQYRQYQHVSHVTAPPIISSKPAHTWADFANITHYAIHALGTISENELEEPCIIVTAVLPTGRQG